MAKKSGSKTGGNKSKGMTAADHRKAAEMLYAKGRLHHAKADLMEAKNPPKKSATPRGIC